MELNSRSRRQLRIQGILFAVLFLIVLGLLGWLSTRYEYQMDWTASGRFTLAPASTEVLEQLDGPVRVLAFARDDQTSAVRQRVSVLLKRYQRATDRLELRFINPDLAPDQVREFGITREGELVLEYAGRREHVDELSEQALTNALLRLLRSGERKLVFLTGHGERSPEGPANHDLSAWVRQLEQKGFVSTTFNPAAGDALPEDASVLVIASPQVELLPGEVKLVREFVQRGGNLLWLVEPAGWFGLEPLARDIGITRVPGTVVDPTGQLLGLDHPALVVTTDYPPHAVTEGLDAVTLYPFSTALELGDGWFPILRTVRQSWSERGDMAVSVGFDEDSETAGPLIIGAVRNGDPEMALGRLAVIGDGDFLSNMYLGNGLNLELGNRLVTWLSRDDALVEIPPRTAPDTRLELSPSGALALGTVWLVVVPLGLLATGFTLAWRRRRR